MSSTLEPSEHHHLGHSIYSADEVSRNVIHEEGASVLNSSWLHITVQPHNVQSILHESRFPEGATDNDSNVVPSLINVLNDVATFRAAMVLITWLFPIVVGVGVVGNLVSLWVLLKRGMRRTSACRYLACLAVADIVILLVSALKTWVRVVWNFELLHVSNVTCKLFIFLTHVSLMTAAWLIVAVTLERFLAVWLPLRATEVCSVGRTRVVMVALLALLALVNSHVFWTAQLLPVTPQHSISPSGVQCSSYAYKTLACQVFPWVHLVLYCFLPAVLLLCLNSLILLKLFQHRQAINASQDSRSSQSSSNRNVAMSKNYSSHHYYQQFRSKWQTKQLLNQQSNVGPSQPSHAPQHFHRRLAPMLLGVSFCWLILTTPQTVYSLAASPPTNYDEVGQQYLIKTICFLLMYLNHAIHFFLYCMTGQRFRKELKRGLLCSDNKRTGHLKNAFLKEWPVHQPAHPSSQVDGGDGAGGGADCVNQRRLTYGNNIHGRRCEYPLIERKQAGRHISPNFIDCK